MLTKSNRKRVSPFLIAILLFMLMLTPPLFTESTRGNFVFPPAKPIIEFQSPVNTTYTTDNISLKLEVYTYKTGYYGAPEDESLRHFLYSVDNGEFQPIKIVSSSVGRNPGADVYFYGLIDLHQQSGGYHNLIVKVVFDYSDLNSPYNTVGNTSEHYNYHTESISNAYFRVDTFAQRISILSPVNETYNPSGIPLIFSLIEPTSWAGYSLDGEGAVTVTGNSTLPELTVGQHTINVSVNDTAGNPTTSNAVTFSVTDPPITLLGFDTVSFIVSIVLAGTAVLAVLVFFYYKRNKC